MRCPVSYQFIGSYFRLFVTRIAVFRSGDSAAMLSPLSGIALLPGLLRILLLLMLRVLATMLTAALLAAAWIVLMGTLSELRALLRIRHLKTSRDFHPFFNIRFALWYEGCPASPSHKLGRSFRRPPI